MKKLIPEIIENKIPSNKFVYYFCWLLTGFNLFRSLEHIFAKDGGAESIAGIPLSSYSPEVAKNIVSIFEMERFIKAIDFSYSKSLILWVPIMILVAIFR